MFRLVKSIEIESRVTAARSREGRGWGLTVSRCKVSFWSDGDGLELYTGDSVQ